MSDPQHHMVPLVALVNALHKGRTLEERFRRMRGKREGMRQQALARVSEDDDASAILETLEPSTTRAGGEADEQEQ